MQLSSYAYNPLSYLKKQGKCLRGVDKKEGQQKRNRRGMAPAYCVDQAF